MNIKSKEKTENSNVELIIGIGAEELNAALNDAYRKNRNNIAVPGFRKGKAPRKIIERMYGSSVFYNDALDILAPSIIEHVVKESDLKIVGYPQITDADIKENEAGADLTIRVAVYPEVTLGEYKGLSAVKPAVEVSDTEIESEIAGIRLRNARIEKADRPAINRDIVLIDYEGFLDGEPFEGGKGEDYELELGSNSFIPGFEEKIQGMTVGEERDLDLVFPENYTESLAGKAVVFKVRLNEVREKILPELDDEFAKDVSEFDTLGEYRASIGDAILKIKQSDADIAFENALIEKIVADMEAEVPDAMVDEQLQYAMNNFISQTSSQGIDPGSYLKMINETYDSFTGKMRESSLRQVRGMLALEKIAELENIEISDEDIEEEYKTMADNYGMEIDDMKDSTSDSVVIREIKLRRAAKIITDNAKPEAPPQEPEADISEIIDAEVEAESEAEAEVEAEVEAEKPKKASTRKPAERKPKVETVPDQDETSKDDAAAESPAKPGARKTAAKKTAAGASLTDADLQGGNEPDADEGAGSNAVTITGAGAEADSKAEIKTEIKKTRKTKGVTEK